MSIGIGIANTFLGDY